MQHARVHAVNVFPSGHGGRRGGGASGAPRHAADSEEVSGQVIGAAVGGEIELGVVWIVQSSAKAGQFRRLVSLRAVAEAHDAAEQAAAAGASVCERVHYVLEAGHVVHGGVKGI